MHHSESWELKAGVIVRAGFALGVEERGSKPKRYCSNIFATCPRPGWRSHERSMLSTR